jgi:cyclopropane fatty-acyl-phospholipid synthase-like methyltransferase
MRDWVQNRQSRRRAFQIGKRHYDIGNDVFRAMLDPSMSYSCGYWKDADTLEAAQRAKLDMVCRKLELAAGERLLDIGCGCGGLAEHAARHYGVEVLGTTVSREQQDLAEDRCRGLPVTIRLQDYRELDGSFDKIASMGMFEHVGPKNYRTYFRIVARLLADDGLMLLHTIGDRISHTGNDPWIDRYIFPNGVVPSARQITTAFEPWLVLEDWHNFGPDYPRTLMAWWDNFSAAWPGLDRHRYDQRFYRMWQYYLHACAAYLAPATDSCGKSCCPSPSGPRSTARCAERLRRSRPSSGPERDLRPEPSGPDRGGERDHATLRDRGAPRQPMPALSWSTAVPRIHDSPNTTDWASFRLGHPQTVAKRLVESDRQPSPCLGVVRRLLQLRVGKIQRDPLGIPALFHTRSPAASLRGRDRPRFRRRVAPARQASRAASRGARPARSWRSSQAW